MSKFVELMKLRPIFQSELHLKSLIHFVVYWKDITRVDYAGPGQGNGKLMVSRDRKLNAKDDKIVFELRDW